MAYSIGVVGAGHWARRLRTGIDDGRFRISKVVDVVPFEEKQELLDDLSVGQDSYYRIDPDDPLPDEFFDGLDVVHIASPVEYHRRQTMEALERGIFTVTEKSYGASREEFEEVASFIDTNDAWDESLIRLHYLHKMPTQEMRSVLERAIERHGPVRRVEATFIEEQNEEDRRRAWLFGPENGGIFLDWIHPIEVLVWACDARFTELVDSEGFLVNPDYTQEFPTAARADYRIDGDMFADDAAATIRVGKGFADGRTHKVMRFVFDDGHIDFRYADAEVEFETDYRGEWLWRAQRGGSAQIVDSGRPSGPNSSVFLLQNVNEALDGGATPLGEETVRRMYDPVWMFNESGGLEDPVTDEARIQEFVADAIASTAGTRVVRR